MRSLKIYGLDGNIKLNIDITKASIESGAMSIGQLKLLVEQNYGLKANTFNLSYNSVNVLKNVHIKNILNNSLADIDLSIVVGNIVSESLNESFYDSLLSQIQSYNEDCDFNEEDDSSITLVHKIWPSILSASCDGVLKLKNKNQAVDRWQYRKVRYIYPTSKLSQVATALDFINKAFGDYAFNIIKQVCYGDDNSKSSASVMLSCLSSACDNLELLGFLQEDPGKLSNYINNLNFLYGLCSEFSRETVLVGGKSVKFPDLKIILGVPTGLAAGVNIILDNNNSMMKSPESLKSDLYKLVNKNINNRKPGWGRSVKVTNFYKMCSCIGIISMDESTSLSS